MSVHSTAIIDPHAKIGRNVTIGPYVVVGPDVEIGDDCKILSHAVIEHASLGSGCTVYPHVCIGLEPQHLKYKGEKTRVKIGSNCVFREGVTIHRGTALDKSVTVIGNNNYFMALSHVAHDCVVGNNVIVANASQIAGHVKIGDYCFISGSVAIHQFVRIGEGSILSGGAMVALDVAPYCIAQGDRAVIRGLNIVGMRRMGMDKTTMKLIREAYRTVFQSGLTLNDALRHPSLSVDNVLLKKFREFFNDPKRGYARPAASLNGDLIPEDGVI